MVPLVGAWTADLELAGAPSLAGQATVVIGNLSLLGTVVRSTDYGGQTRCRLVGGYGGWRKQVSAQGYGGGAVPLAHVLQDVALAAGETMGPVAAGLAGQAWGRLAGAGSDVLWQCVMRRLIPSWRVDASGVTQVTPWPTTPVTSPFTVTDQRPDQGIVIIATEDYASWLPGRTFAAPQLDGAFQIAGVLFQFGDEGQFRLEVLTGTTDRLLGPLAQFVDTRVQRTRFYGRYEYTLTTATTATVDATPVDRSLGLPDVKLQPLCGDSISSYMPAPGATCHIQFLNGDPARPTCVWTSGPPTTVAIGETPLPVAAALGTVAAFGAVETFALAVQTVLSQMTNGYSSLSPGQISTWNGAVETAQAALTTTAAAAVPTKTITAGP
jgi:hypothetical protein